MLDVTRGWPPFPPSVFTMMALLTDKSTVGVAVDLGCDTFFSLCLTLKVDARETFLEQRKTYVELPIALRNQEHKWT